MEAELRIYILAFAEVRALRAAEVEALLERDGVAPRLRRRVSRGSEILVLDEIFAVGEAGFKSKCEERYQQLRNKGHATVMVSHDPRAVSLFCERAIILDGSRVAFQGTGHGAAIRYLDMFQVPWQPSSEPPDTA